MNKRNISDVQVIMKNEPPSTSMDLKAEQDLLTVGSEVSQHDSESIKTEHDLHNSGSEGLQQYLCNIGAAAVKAEQDLNQFDSERPEDQLYDPGSMGIKAEPLLSNFASDELQQGIQQVSMKPLSPSVSTHVAHLNY